MAVLCICRKILSIGLILSFFICAVLFAKELFFDRECGLENKCYCIDDIQKENGKKDYTKISFQNGEEGFSIELCGQDCFANFYRAKRGACMSTKTEVCNFSEAPVSVILRAASCRTKACAEEIALLSRHTDIKVSNEKGLILYNGKVWNENGEPRNISLGTYGIDEKRTLKIDLQLSEEVGETVSDTCKNIIWIFSGLNAEIAVAAPKSSLVSSKNFLMIALAILGVLVILSVIISYLNRKSSRR